MWIDFISCKPKQYICNVFYYVFVCFQIIPRGTHIQIRVVLPKKVFRFKLSTFFQSSPNLVRRTVLVRQLVHKFPQLYQVCFHFLTNQRDSPNSIGTLYLGNLTRYIVKQVGETSWYAASQVPRQVIQVYIKMKSGMVDSFFMAPKTRNAKLCE